MNFTAFHRQGKGALLQILYLILLTALFSCEASPGEQRAVTTSNGAASHRDDGAQEDEEGAGAERAGATKTPPSVVTSAELPDQPQRIVSLAPNVTEILFDLGVGERIVGVTRFCDYPPEAKAIAKVGGIVDTDFEAILSMRPDLVVGTSSGADPKIARQLEQADLAYGFVRMDNLEQTYRGIETIGELVGEPKRGAAMAETMRKQIGEVAERATDIDPSERPRVLMVYGRSPLVAAGPDTFGHELVELAGGDNVLADAKTSYPKLDIEKVISLNPERIIDASTAVREGKRRDFWTQYAAIDAVKADQVHLIEDPVVLRPAPRLVEGFKRIRRAVRGGKGKEENERGRKREDGGGK